MRQSPFIPDSNLLLAAMPYRDRKRFIQVCELVDLQYGQELSPADGRIRHAYFPVGALISLVAPIDARAALEVGLVGNEGMTGIALFLGLDGWPLQALVQGSGKVLRIGDHAFRKEVASSPALVQVLQRYLYVTTVQFAQTAACTRFHGIDERLARWLLMMHDRAHSDTFHITHEFLAYMLGVRRVGVTRAATALRQRGLIRYHRGDIAILSREGLEAASCGCYEADKQFYEQTMGSSAARRVAAAAIAALP